MNELQIFNYEAKDVRTVTIDNEPWWVAKDICDILEISNSRDAIQRIDSDDVGLTDIIDSIGRNQKSNIINESGLYALILQSRKPEAKKFKKWITSEVIPSIRKTGSYVIAPKNDDELILIGYKKLMDRVDSLKIELQEAQPKIELYDQAMNSTSTFPMGDVSKILNLGMGRNDLFRFLKNSHVLDEKNKPYQKYVDAGYFKLIETAYTNESGVTFLNTQCVAFQKGLDFISKLIKKDQEQQLVIAQQQTIVRRRSPLAIAQR